MSHLPRNAGVFEESDIAVGIEFLSLLDEREAINPKEIGSFETAVSLVSSISSQSCAFRLQEPPNAKQFGSIIMKSRSALHGATASGVFLAMGSISFSFYVALTACLPLRPTVPLLGSSVYLQLILPCLGLSLCFTESDGQAMKKVPPKNDASVTFNRKEGHTFFALTTAKSILPALLPQLLHLIIQGSVRAQFSSETMCPDSNRWTDGIRCTADPSPAEDRAWSSSGMCVFVAFVVNISVASAGCMHRFTSFSNKAAWTWNFLWLGAFASTLLSSFMILSLWVTDDVQSTVPWYSYLIAITAAVVCLLAVELLKTAAISQEVRAEKLRRLQFETRLGAWSPR
jgi:magnesium-transporting ATPase (P-type)